METGDKILLFRGLLGVTSSILSFLSSWTIQSYLAAIITPLVIYVASIPIVRFGFRTSSRWHLIGKGSLTFFAAWFLIWTILIQN
jgi:hypothetical protein